MFDSVSNPADIRPLAQPAQPSDPLKKLLDEAYRRGYSAGHKAGFDAACKVSAK